MPKKNCLTTSQINALKQFIEKKNGTARELSRAQAIFMHEEKMARDLIKMLTGVKKVHYLSGVLALLKMA